MGSATAGPARGADDRSGPAAATGPADGSGRRRPGALWRVGAPVVFALAGVLFATSFQAASGTDLRSDRDLPALVADANQAVASKAERVKTLQAEIDELTVRTAPGDQRLTSLTGTIGVLGPVTGTRAVAGPVLTVVLDDSALPLAQLPPTVRADDLVVHQQDVQAVVNALWRGGAEAMMIMDQRVIATSAVRCVGNTLILQGRVYSPPFVIRAMGRLDDLRAALDADPQIAVYKQWVDAVGLGYQVSESTGRDEFPGFSGALGVQLATVPR